MAGEQEELRLDLEELRHLESIAKRPRVLYLLSSEIRNVDAKLSTAAATTAAAVEKAPAAAAARNYTNLSSFSWDQDNDKIKLQELERLSNFEEPFSNEDLEKLQLISGIKSTSSSSSLPLSGRPPLNPVPSKARSKRSRSDPCSWSSRPDVISPEPLEVGPKLVKKKESTYRQRGLCMDGRKCLHCGVSSQWRIGPMGPKTLCNACGVRLKSGWLVPDYQPATSWSSRPVVISPEPPEVGPKPVKKKEPTDRQRGLCMDGRKCLHCGADKTPQWRMGPMGPKTLCNACGVRFRSGQLVSEYRPATSPTFVMSEHSNSHRKVLELRRQKEMMQQ